MVNYWTRNFVLVHASASIFTVTFALPSPADAALPSCPIGEGIERGNCQPCKPGFISANGGPMPCTKCVNSISVICSASDYPFKCVIPTSSQWRGNLCASCPSGLFTAPDKNGQCLSCITPGSLSCNDQGTTNCGSGFKYVAAVPKSRSKAATLNSCAGCPLGQTSAGGKSTTCYNN